MSLDSDGGMTLTGENRRTRRRTCPSATLSTTNPTCIDPGANPGLRSERPVTNDLSPTHHRTFLTMCDVPRTAVFLYSSVERFPRTISRYCLVPQLQFLWTQRFPVWQTISYSTSAEFIYLLQLLYCNLFSVPFLVTFLSDRESFSNILQCTLRSS
jgi:hypothetical protein